MNRTPLSARRSRQRGLSSSLNRPFRSPLLARADRTGASQVGPASVQASPVLSTSVQASPFLSASVQASPVLSASVQDSPVLSAGVQASPVLSASVQASPVLSASVQASPVLSAAGSSMDLVRRSLTAVGSSVEDMALCSIPSSGRGDGASTPVQSAAAAITEEELTLDVQIAALTSAGCRVEDLGRYMDALHRYNEIKDVVQVVMGQLAELDGVTNRAVHRRFSDTLPESEMN